jgi:hypothetical protein
MAPQWKPKESYYMLTKFLNPFWLNKNWIISDLNIYLFFPFLTNLN